jgi:predicted O-linked N-acetylglucosamine transferase (SPINDLY family)
VSELCSDPVELGMVDLLSLADKLNKAGDVQLVPSLYRAWIESNLGHPQLYVAYFNYSVMLSETTDRAGTKAALAECVRINPDFLPAYINMGFALERLGAIPDAILQWFQVINKLQALTSDALSYKISALKQIGRLFEAAKLTASAEDILTQSLELDPNQPEVIQHWLSLRQQQCEWPIIAPWGLITREALIKDMSPLSLAIYTDDPLLQLGNAARYCDTPHVDPLAVKFMDAHRSLCFAPTPSRLRVGYLSTDLREHAIGYLMAELFELHDRDKFEVFVYYCGHEVNDQVHQRIKAASEHWVDLTGLTDEAAAFRITSDQVGVLIDVNGHTHGARAKLLAMRPAPVIVNWLGFPGTAGSPYHNYIIADEFIIPPEHEIWYSEKVKRLPCYQPNDRKRTVADPQETRLSAGLPETGMVYCCFNGAHKITSFTWRRWMSILEQVPGSVLWLLDMNDDLKTKLQDLAARYEIAPQRLVFAPRVSNADHLARYPLADLFLDTSPYGAHTTASDALWMGVPVLTLAGRGFASRVCGSLVKSAGISELICTKAEDYVRTAVELGKDSKRLQSVRSRLREGRDACALFDTPALVTHLEAIYVELWEDIKQDKVFRPDLSNLQVYAQIGAMIDNDATELLTVDNYVSLYKDQLAARDRYCFIPPDSRLWRSDPPARQD